MEMKKFCFFPLKIVGFNLPMEAFSSSTNHATILSKSYLSTSGCNVAVAAYNYSPLHSVIVRASSSILSCQKFKWEGSPFWSSKD